mmetsp:Transcript_91298/g.246786  ORF Transcript_91298/g.246786 Transcript_91298/m.246786 type:complete len:230 (-) Transcript_91298:840-1529(-)
MARRAWRSTSNIIGAGPAEGQRPTHRGRARRGAASAKLLPRLPAFSGRRGGRRTQATGPPCRDVQRRRRSEWWCSHRAELDARLCAMASSAGVGARAAGARRVHAEVARALVLCACSRAIGARLRARLGHLAALRYPRGRRRHGARQRRGGGRPPPRRCLAPCRRRPRGYRSAARWPSRARSRAPMARLQAQSTRARATSAWTRRAPAARAPTPALEAMAQSRASSSAR